MTVDPRTLATSRDPHAALVEQTSCPAHRADDGAVVVSRRAEVVQVLEDPRAGVLRPVLAAGPLADLVAGMARFRDGSGHRAARSRVESLVAAIDLPAVRAAVVGATRSEVAGRNLVDVMPIARRVPVRVLAGTLGVGHPDAAAAAVDGLCRRLAPRRGASPVPGVPGLPVGGSPTTRAPLPGVVGVPGLPVGGSPTTRAPTPRPSDADLVDALAAGVGPLAEPHIIAVLSLLFQALDATAGLVAQRVLASDVAPVILTTRRAGATMQVGRRRAPRPGLRARPAPLPRT